MSSGTDVNLKAILALNVKQPLTLQNKSLMAKNKVEDNSKTPKPKQQYGDLICLQKVTTRPFGERLNLNSSQYISAGISGATSPSFPAGMKAQVILCAAVAQ